MSIILKTPSNGSVTLAEQDTASDVVVTVPAVTSTLLNNSSGVMNIGSGQVYKDAAGNLGLGVTPSAWSSSKALEIGGTALPIIGLNGTGNSGFITQNAYFNGTNWIYKTSSVRANLAALVNGAHQWYTAPSGTAGNAISFTQVMTLESAGNLLLRATSTSWTNTDAIMLNAANGDASFLHNSAKGDGSRFIWFVYNANQIGSISQAGTTQVSYNTTSDYRLKENVAPMTGALDKVAALKPCTYTWKSDGSAGQGFIAHELQDVVPDCVTGEKDAVDKDGKPQYQGVDTSFLVATLVSAIQEQQAIIIEQQAALTQLQADVAALQGAA